MRLFQGNLPQKRQSEREREKERKKERKNKKDRKNEKKKERKKERMKKRKKERKKASWMPNDMVTAGNTAPLVEFPLSVLPVLWMGATVFTWFTSSSMDCGVWSQVIAFGGPYRFTVFRAHLIFLKKSCNLKVVFSHFDRDSYIYI